MRYRRLGRDGPEVSVVSLGTWPLGGGDWGRLDPETAIATIRAALDAGVNLIDTADAYGAGRAEVLVSLAVEGRRDDVFIASKCGIAFQEPGGGIDLRASYVKHAVEQSLVRLNTDRIDLLQLHWPDGQPIEEAWRALVELREEGKVRFLGVSNFGVAQLESLEAIRHVDSLQSQYSMLWRDPEADVLPCCAEREVGFLAYGPLAYGLLSGKYRDRGELTDWRTGAGEYGSWNYIERLFASGRFERHVETVERLRPIAEGLGVTLSQLALAWVLSRPGVTCAIPGARSPEQARQNAAAADTELDADARARIEELPWGDRPARGSPGGV